MLSAAGIRSHLHRELLPLWHRCGIDRERGGFHNGLDRELAPVADGYKRMLVQTRQTWTFARAALTDGAAAWRAAAAHGFEFLCERFSDRANGGLLLTVRDDGEPLDRTRDCYSHAFALLAAAAYGALGEDARASELAFEVRRSLERLRDRAGGGFFEAADPEWRPLQRDRRQNPHMHLLEALLAAHETWADPADLALCDELYELLRARFIDAKSGFLREHFAPDWSPHPGAQASALEPGHHFEWASLLHEYAKRRGRREALELADDLFAFAERHGIDREQGGVWNEIAPDGVVRDDRKRLWPQTEHLRALALRVERGIAAREELEGALGLCFERYVDPVSRGWHEQADRSGCISSERMNATSVYHVYGALSEVARVLALSR